MQEDAYAKFKYDAAAEADGRIIARVAELADRRGVSMTEISLAWLLTKVTSPVVGATKFSHVDGAARAVDLELTHDEIDYLEELYVPHALVGVMAQNGKKRTFGTRKSRRWPRRTNFKTPSFSPSARPTTALRSISAVKATSRPCPASRWAFST